MYSYFNECLPRDQVVEQYASALQSTTQAYASLKSKHPGLEGIVSTVDWNTMIMNDAGISLRDCIEKIGSRALRNLISSWLTHYPVREYLDETINEDELVEQNYTLSVAGKEYEATNLAIAYNNGIFLFTLGVHADLRKNELTLKGSVEKTITVCNLYGNEQTNVSFVEQFVTEAENSSLSISEQIDRLLGGRVKRTSAYQQSFRKLGAANQQAILDRLKEAEEQKLLGFRVDNDIFRHTSGYDKKEKFYGPVYELRVREPKEIRIYFQYVESVYYVLSMGWKGTDQNADIGQAFERIRQIRQI